MAAFICVPEPLGWNKRIFLLCQSSLCDLISWGGSGGMTSTTRYCGPPNHRRHFKRLFLFFSNSFGIPLFSKSALQQVKKVSPCAVTQKQSFIWLPRLLVISFSIAMLFSLLPPLSYYQGFLCQKQLIGKVGGSFLHLWVGKSDVTPRLRGQLLWEVNRDVILAAVLWKCCRYSFSTFLGWMGSFLTTCKLKRLEGQVFPTICFHQMKLPISGIDIFFRKECAS